MRPLASAFALPLVAMACSSFGTSTDEPPTTDGGVADAPLTPGDGASDASPSGPFRCPTPTPANTQCWDFEDNVAISAETSVGKVARESGSAAEGSWMTATAPAVPSGQAWARVVNIVGKVTPTFDIDARVSVSNGYAGPLVRISLTGSGDRHEVSVDADDGTLSLVQGTFIGGSVANGTYGKDPLGSVTLDRWFQLHMRVAFSTGAADVTIEIDRNPKFGGQSSTIGSALKATGAAASFGLVNVYQATTATAARFDDVKMSWTLP